MSFECKAGCLRLTEDAATVCSEQAILLADIAKEAGITEYSVAGVQLTYADKLNVDSIIVASAAAMTAALPRVVDFFRTCLGRNVKISDMIVNVQPNLGPGALRSATAHPLRHMTTAMDAILFTIDLDP